MSAVLKSSYAESACALAVCGGAEATTTAKRRRAQLPRNCMADTPRAIPAPPAPRHLLRDGEPEVADLSVADDVVLADAAEQPLGAQVGEGTFGGDQLVVAVDLRADEATRDIGVHGARGVL